MTDNLVFVFPYKGVGGIPVLFIRLSEFLAKLPQLKIYVVDYSDGYIARYLQSENVTIIDYHDDAQICLPDSSLLIFQAMTPWSIFPSLQFNSTHSFLFWHCHPYNLVPVLPGLRNFLLRHINILDVVNKTLMRAYLNKSRRFSRVLDENGALLFMDEANFKSLKDRLDIELVGQRYLPIPVQPNEQFPIKTDRQATDCIKLIWVGRIVDFKFHILFRAVERLVSAQGQFSEKIMLTVVGDGDHLDKLKSMTKTLPIYIDFYGQVSSTELDELLSRHDVLIGMGTSALEGAKFGLPTILADFSYGEVSAYYKFTWLHDTRGYSLGAPITKAHLTDRTDSISKLIEEALENYEHLARKSYDYFSNNHSIDAVATGLLEYGAKSDCNYAKLVNAGLLNRGIIYSIFYRLKNWRQRS